MRCCFFRVLFLPFRVFGSFSFSLSFFMQFANSQIFRIQAPSQLCIHLLHLNPNHTLWIFCQLFKLLLRRNRIRNALQFHVERCNRIRVYPVDAVADIPIQIRPHILQFLGREQETAECDLTAPVCELEV
ncbi:hypothetical protein BDR26DRAFT_879592 [Obelidium mucronatum]|nr:hypothetical protein BDR26DRAFT_879592 [Obelidium mucronatum]